MLYNKCVTFNCTARHSIFLKVRRSINSKENFPLIKSLIIILFKTVTFTYITTIINEM